MPDIKVEELGIEERRKRIIELLNHEGKVKVVDLSKLFSISEVTIRNDLTELEAEGMLERIHGGAVSTYRSYFNMNFQERMKTNEEEKRRIAAEAASMIAEGDTVILGSGTTPMFILQELRDIKSLTVVTNSLSVAQKVGYSKNIHTIMLGGNINTQYQFTYGDDTINQLKKYKAGKLFLSADGISAEEGVTTYHHLEAEMNRQMIARANKTIVVADYTKIGRASFAYIEDIDRIDCLISNQKASKEEVEAVREKGVEVRLV